MSGGEGQPEAVTEAVPMRPRRALLRALLALYVLWMAALAGLWYATVYAPRKAAPTPATQPTEVGDAGLRAVGVGRVGVGPVGFAGVVSGMNGAGEAGAKSVGGR